jgi:hypothetical protein
MAECNGTYPPSRRAGGVQALNPWFKNEAADRLRRALKLAVFMDVPRLKA